MIAINEPIRVTAGDTISWAKTLADYPAGADWVLAYTLINATHKQTITASASGDDHVVTVAAATSATWAAGTYTWIAIVTKATERYTVGQGSLVVAPNLASATTYDTRSSAKKALEAIDALLETYGTKAYMQGYEIAGRKMQFRNPAEFMAFRDKLKGEVAKEDNAARLAAGLAPRNQVAVRFNTR